MALHDLIGKRLGIPLYKFFGLNPARVPETSFTIAIDQPEVMAARAKESGLPILKIKVGAGDDVAMVRAIRDATNARLAPGRQRRLDARAGGRRSSRNWPSTTSSSSNSRWRARIGKACAGSSARVSVPIFADESAQTERDLPKLAGRD